MRFLLSWMVIGCLSFAVNVFAFDSDRINCQKHHCAAIVDMGSTGSRVHLYTYDNNAQGSTQNINEVYLKKINPGLGTLSGDATTIDNYFDKLMAKFPKDHIPIYVYATAGMRLLSQEEQNQRYELITQWFANHPKWLLQEARTISGTAEGIYGFLGLNYHLQTLQNPDQPLVGLIEVGGTSTQISFPIQDTVGLDPNDVMTMDLYGRHLQLYAHSFLRLGAYAVFKQAQNETACFPVGYPLENDLIASGDAAQCQEKMSDLLNNIYQVNATTLPALKTIDTLKQWYVTAAVSSLVRTSPMTFANGKFTAKELLQQADINLCHQTYQTLMQQYPVDESIAKNCMLAAYFYGLWVNGYHFNPEEEIHFFADYDADWTLGVIVNPLLSLKNKD